MTIGIEHRPLVRVESRTRVSYAVRRFADRAAEELVDQLTTLPDFARTTIVRERDKSVSFKASPTTLATEDDTWTATVGRNHYALAATMECAPESGVRARFDALTHAIERTIRPVAGAHVESCYEYTLFGVGVASFEKLIRPPLFDRSLRFLSQAVSADDVALIEQRFPLADSTCLTCRHGFLRSASGNVMFRLTSELGRSDVARFDSGRLLEAVDAIHFDHRGVLLTCLTDDAATLLFPKP